MAIKYVFFDIDGVIVHGERFSDRYTKEFGLDLEVMLEFFDGVFQDCLIGKADLKEELAKVQEKWGWQGTTNELLDYWFGTEDEVDKRMIEIVNQLKANGVKCIGVTNQEKYRTKDLKKEMGLGELLDEVIASSDIGHKKPEAEFYHQVVDRIGIEDYAEVVFFDDDQSNVNTANELGMNAYFFTDFAQFIEVMKQHFDFIIDTTKSSNFYKDYVFNGKIKVDKEFEDDKILAFHHTKPHHKFHVVIVPKADILSVATAEDMTIVKEIFEVMQDIINRYELHKRNYKIINNGGSYQHSQHLHFHLVSDDE